MRKKLQAGDVIGAIDLVNEIDPKILQQNPKLLFHLKQQRLIELIRNKEVSGSHCEDWHFSTCMCSTGVCLARACCCYVGVNCTTVRPGGAGAVQ